MLQLASLLLAGQSWWVYGLVGLVVAIVAGFTARWYLTTKADDVASDEERDPPHPEREQGHIPEQQHEQQQQQDRSGDNKDYADTMTSDHPPV